MPLLVVELVREIFEGKDKEPPIEHLESLSSLR